MQNIRRRVAARLAGEESGFTLIELLVVMLILGILAAIALPAFFNQKDKAGDAKAKENAHSAQVAMETCASDKGGKYYVSATDQCDLAALQAVEPSIPSTGVTVTPNTPTKGYTIQTAGSVGWFKIIRKENGGLEFTCEKGGEGGCAGTKGSAGTWGA